MSIKIVGVERNGGNFKNDEGSDVPYDNLIFHILADTNKKVKGLSTGTCKLAVKKLKDVIGSEDYESLVGKEVVMDYIPNGKAMDLVSISVVPSAVVPSR